MGFDVASTGLTYTQGINELNTSGGALSAFRSSGSASNKSVQAAPDSFGTNLPQTIWMSMLVNYDGTAETGSALLGFTIDDGTLLADDNQRVFGIGIAGGNVGAVQGRQASANIGDDGWPANDLGLSLSTGVNLLVARVDNGSPDTMTVFLNPTLGGGTPTGGTSVPLVDNGLVAGNGSWGVSSIFAAHNFDNGSDSVLDEFRLGESFSDVTPFTVVPEPSTFALLAGFLALGSVMLRRRQS